MIHLTMIARVYDGLPLTASLQDENLTEYQNKGLNSTFDTKSSHLSSLWSRNHKSLSKSKIQSNILAKAIFRKLNNQSAPQMSIEHANMTFHYQIDQVRIIYQMLT